MTVTQSSPIGRLVRFAATLALPLVLGTLARAQMDHSFLSEYNGTATCLGCHRSHGEDFMRTIHWTWEHTDTETGQALGKNNVINNYCIALGSNEPRCTSCHAGLGYADQTFDFTDINSVDCLICHDATGTYKKFPTGAGHPVYDEPKEFPPGSGNMWPPVDLLNVAKNVSRPTRSNCGACHFFGGGGDAVKHGDLDSTMTHPDRDLDFHMGGLGFECTSCHVPDSEDAPHTIVGTRYSAPGPDNELCQSCHTTTPHESDRLNTHATRVSCQACHVPAFARGGKATKMWWDWSSAGEKNPDGSDIVRKDADGNVIYDTKKGNFVWEKNVIPDYVWFNGKVTYTTLDDTIDPSVVVTINALQGDIDDPNARIMPVKRFRGIQPYDVGNSTLAVPHLFGSDPEAYWKSYDWDRALAAGMDYVGREYAGPVGYIETEMFWVQNHMVAPKEQAVSCNECHTPRGRLDFKALGYSGQRAAELESMFGSFQVNDIALTPDSSSIELRWWGMPGNQYQVQSSNDLSTWENVQDGLFSPSGDSSEEFTWSEAVASGSYYRIIRSSQ